MLKASAAKEKPFPSSRCRRSGCLQPCASLNAKRNHRPLARTFNPLQFPQQLGFQILRVRNHLASGNLLIAGTVITQFANPQATLRSHRRTKSSARHGASLVKITQSGLWIEHRTEFVVSKFCEPIFRLRTFVQHARLRIPGKIRRQPRDRSSRPRANAACPLRIRFFQIGQPVLQPHGIQLMNGKHSHTALRASGMACKPFAAAPRGIRQSSIHDLDQFTVASRQSPQRHAGSIPHRRSDEVNALSPAITY
jgi:hypothetical protein